MTELLKTPLHAEHVRLKGRMVPFGGWDMPVQYAGLMKEHECVRQDVGLFDVCHMGEFLISGDQAKSFLNRVTTNDVTKLYDGRSQYSLLCYDNGTVVDDLIISQISDNEFLAVVNASNIQKDFDWLCSQNKEGVELKNISDDTALIAIQGPKANELMADVLGQDLSDLKYYHFKKYEHNGALVHLSRTGYTGEDGFELMVSSDQAAAYWNLLLESGQKYKVQPIGLGARDTLRLEASYSLYGHEISDKINPLEAKLGWIIKMDKGDFIGKAALQDSKTAGLKNKLVGLEMVDAGVARDGYELWDENQKVGVVTSGTHSPTLKKAVALGFVPVAMAVEDQKVWIDVRGKKKQAKIVKTPFYKR